MYVLLSILVTVFTATSFAADLQTDEGFFTKELPAKKQDSSADVAPKTVETKPKGPPPKIKIDDPGDSDSAIAEEPMKIDTSQPPKQLPKPPDTSNYTSDPKFFHHPLTEKGLIRIDSDRAYIYDVPHSLPTRGGSLRFGVYDPTLLANPSTGVRFNSLYNSSNDPMILFDYEWLLWRSVGKFYYTVGAGFFTASGHGQFQIQTYLTPLENFTFLMFPLHTGVTWRAQFWDRQLFVPYVTGGASAFCFTEIRDDNHGPRFGGSPGAYGGGGLAINMNFMDTRSMLDLDRDYGISSVWLTLEFQREQSLITNFNFSGNYINGGFFVEF